MSDSGYVDVFISHKKEDLPLARRLLKRVQALKCSAYLDDADEHLAAAETTSALAERIRSSLRRAKCLLFVMTPKSIESKWMPWELGFFDGRWGRPTVGLYVQGLGGDAAGRSGKASGFSVQEYLDLYESVDDETLAAFLERATSGGMLANRRDVDIDRLLTLLSSAGRNPVAFQLGCGQYLLGMLQPIAEAYPPWRAMLAAQIDLLARMRSAVDVTPSQTGGADPQDPFAAWARGLGQAHAGGVEASAAPGAPAAAAWDPLKALDPGDAVAMAQRAFEQMMAGFAKPAG